jgi:hypothetical protein
MFKVVDVQSCRLRSRCNFLLATSYHWEIGGRGAGVKLESVYLFASCFPESCSADLVFRCTFLQLFFSSASMEIGEELGSALAAGGRNGG